MTTFKQVKEEVRALGLTVTKRGDEYRVNYPNGREETAYYSNDPDDAIGTARAMSQFKDKRL